MDELAYINIKEGSICKVLSSDNILGFFDSYPLLAAMEKPFELQGKGIVFRRRVIYNLICISMTFKVCLSPKHELRLKTGKR